VFSDNDSDHPSQKFATSVSWFYGFFFRKFLFPTYQLNRASQTYGLEINIDKTKITATKDIINNITVNENTSGKGRELSLTLAHCLHKKPNVIKTLKQN